MKDAEDSNYDTRRLEKMRKTWLHIPGELRLCHLDGPCEEYVLTAWHVGVGSEIQAPQTVATVETSLFILEIECFDSGILAEQFFSIGDMIPDGAVIARITVTPSA